MRMKYTVYAVLVSVLSSMGFVVLAQEPALNIQAPATAPILDAEPEAKPAAPVVKEAVPVVKPVHHVTTHPLTSNASVATHSVTTNAQVPHAAPHVAATPTNNVTAPVTHVVAHPATNAVVLPITQVTDVPEGDQFFVDTWKHPSFQIGTRVIQVELTDTTRGTPFNDSFVGSITEITEEQDTAPNKLYVQARIPKTPCWLGVSYDHVRAQTMDDSDGDGLADSGGGDGAVDVEGYIAYLQAAWDNTTRFTPFIQVGYAFYDCNFEENANWSNGGQKAMTLDSTTGFELAAGLGIRIYRNLSADVFYRQMAMDDITGEYTMNGDKMSDVIYTMSYTGFGAGINCRF